MKYYIEELQENEAVKNTAGIKARDDAAAILAKNGYQRLDFVWKDVQSSSVFDAMKNHRKKTAVLEELLADLKEKDELVVQLPVINDSIYHHKVFKNLQKRGVKISCLIHDLESLRFAKRSEIPFRKRYKLKIEEKNVLKCASVVIAHNDRMKERIAALGIAPEKIVSLEIFDYLIPEYEQRKNEIEKNRRYKGPVIIAGALRRHKVGYVYDLPKAPMFNLYGIGYEEEGRENVNYVGVFPPDDLPFSMEGSFGLVWDGSSAASCEGVYGQYLKINNPHKTSLYLASTIPVVIWSEAALAEFVKANGCGICVESLSDLETAVNSLSEEEYEKIVENTRTAGKKIREGYYLMKALECGK